MIRSKKTPTDLESLMPESCFMDLKQYNTKEVRDRIEDKSAYEKTIRAMLHEAIKQHRRK